MTGTWYPPSLGTAGVLIEAQLFTNPPFKMTTTPNRDHQHGGIEPVGTVAQLIKATMRDGRRVEVLPPGAFPAPDGAPLQVLPEDAQVIEPTERTILVPARTPVPVSERPWEREGWCDEQGQCWMGDPGGGGFIPSWRLCRPEDAPSMKVSLPFNALPLPAGGEVE